VRRVGDEAAPVPRALPTEIADAWQQGRGAFLAPLREARARLAELALRQREGVGDLLAVADEIASLQAGLAPFVQRYALDAPARRPAAGRLRGGRGARRAGRRSRRDRRANALLLLAAALDGHGAVPALANAALLPPSPALAAPACAGQALGTLLPAAATVMRDARRAADDARKSEAMRALLRTAGWQWAGAALLGLALLRLARRTVPPLAVLAAAFAAWAIAAWAARVPWPLAPARAFLPAREDASIASLPTAWPLALLAGAAALLALAARRRGRDGRPAPVRAPQAVASRAGYPGFVLAAGVGWLLLLDLSAHAHPANRYLALYHQGHLWLAMLLLTAAAAARQPLARALAAGLSIGGDLGRSLGARLGRPASAAMLAAAGLALAGVVAATLRGLPQLSSEIGRLWAIAGGAWFFYLRGGPLAERLARAPRPLASLARWTWPLAFVTGVLAAIMAATADMGPLLVSMYGAGAFVAASLAAWRHQRGGGRAGALLLAAAIFVAWIAAVTAALFRLGALDDVTAARLESVTAPLASANDQIALVTWFQRAAPAGGFGVGAAPWCGHAPADACAGVPAQIHSDYTFTALVGVFGSGVAWAFTLGMAAWLHRLVRQHGRVTRGEPRFVGSATGGLASDDQAFLSWLCVAWVVLTASQLAVTVAGNLAVLPLTGVTYPFVSFGMTSLAVNAAFLGLCLAVDRTGRTDGTDGTGRTTAAPAASRHG
jgi:cell division protein FtsW (lipid II flippase)